MLQKCHFCMLTEYHLCRRFSPSVVLNAMKSRNPYCTEILIAFIGYLDNLWFFCCAAQRLVGLLLLSQLFRIYVSPFPAPPVYVLPHTCIFVFEKKQWNTDMLRLFIPHWGWLKRGLCPTNAVRSLWYFNVMEGHHLSFTSDLLKL